jgi:hypothetical protein
MNGSNFPSIITDGIPNPSFTMNNGGALYTGFIRVADGSAPEASDNDQVVASFVPVAGGWTEMTLVADPDVPRTLLYTIVDANSSMTGVQIRVYGTDQFGRKVKEVIRSKGGSKTISGRIAFASVSKAEYKVGGTVTAVSDTIKIGTTNVLGLPVAVARDTDVLRKTVGGNTADAGAIDTRFHTWTPENGNLPNGAKTFEVVIRSTYKPKVVQDTFYSTIA